MNPHRILVGDRRASQQAPRARRINPTLPGQKRSRPWIWYDTVSVAANTATGTELSFFTTPKGQNSKTLLQTNMTLPGALPAGWDFDLYAIRLGFLSQTRLADVHNLYENFYCQLDFNGTTWFQGWPEHFPGGGGVSGADINAAASFLNNGAPDPRSIMTYPDGIRIAAGEQFSFKLLSPTGFTTLDSGGTGLTVRVSFEGQDNSIIS